NHSIIHSSGASMGDNVWSCVFSCDHPAKKRKRWTDGTLVYHRGSNKLQLRNDSNTQTLASGKAGSSGGGGAGCGTSLPQQPREGEEFRVGRYAVQVGETRSTSGSGGGDGSSEAVVATVGTTTAATGIRQTGQRMQLQKPTTGGGGGGAAAGTGMPMTRRGKFKAPARLNGGQPKKAGHVSQEREQEQGQLQGQTHDQGKKQG
ncbi:unnamed protein product, partial [Ectocarpus sp. 4 AP-2014]